ncbi:hypothetical protein ACQP2K_04990 [Microbispora siamensis]
MCYTISRFGGAALKAAFLHALESDVFTLVELTKPDLARVDALVKRYADFLLGAVDASVVAVAERLKVTGCSPPSRRSVPRTLARVHPCFPGRASVAAAHDPSSPGLSVSHAPPSSRREDPDRVP